MPYSIKAFSFDHRWRDISLSGGWRILTQDWKCRNYNCNPLSERFQGPHSQEYHITETAIRHEESLLLTQNLRSWLRRTLCLRLTWSECCLVWCLYALSSSAERSQVWGGSDSSWLLPLPQWTWSSSLRISLRIPLADTRALTSSTCCPHRSSEASGLHHTHLVPNVPLSRCKDSMIQTWTPWSSLYQWS